MTDECDIAMMRMQCLNLAMDMRRTVVYQSETPADTATILVNWIFERVGEGLAAPAEARAVALEAIRYAVSRRLVRDRAAEVLTVADTAYKFASETVETKRKKRGRPPKVVPSKVSESQERRAAP